MQAHAFSCKTLPNPAVASNTCLHPSAFAKARLPFPASSKWIPSRKQREGRRFHSEFSGRPMHQRSHPLKTARGSSILSRILRTLHAPALPPAENNVKVVIGAENFEDAQCERVVICAENFEAAPRASAKNFEGAPRASAILRNCVGSC